LTGNIYCYERLFLAGKRKMQKEELQVDLNFSHSVVWAYRVPTLQKGLSESTRWWQWRSPSSWTAITL